MALDAATFKERFPEFDQLADSVVTAKLDQAARSLDATVAGDAFDDIQGLHAAQLLALGPEGQEAGLRLGTGANQRTPYDAELERLRRLVGTAYRLVLD